MTPPVPPDVAAALGAFWDRFWRQDLGSDDARSAADLLATVTALVAEARADAARYREAWLSETRALDALVAEAVGRERERCAEMAECVKVRGMRAGHIADQWDICCDRIAALIRQEPRVRAAAAGSPGSEL